MCILFLKTKKCLNSDEYKLILAANRDEYYKRPAKVAHFWEENSNIVGGRDMEPGREGGTWLAMNKHGKIAVLINIMSNRANNEGKLGRGFLINNFLNSDRTLTGFDYGMKLLREEGDLEKKFNPFNLVTIDLKTEIDQDSKPMITCISNGDKDASQQPVILENSQDNIFAFGNSPTNFPFKKVTNGKEEFERLTSFNSTSKDRDNLIDGLLKILKSEESHLPDENLKLFVPEYSQSYVKNLSCRMLKIPEIMYGSRTHTIILVNSQDQIEFNEWTMKEPIDISNPVWIHTKFTFLLENKG